MKLKVIVHEAEEGGFWAEVPAIPGCSTEGEDFEELLKNLYEAKRLRDVYPWTSRQRRWEQTTGFSKLRYEIRFGQRALQGS